MWSQETLPVDFLDEAVFRALNWSSPRNFNAGRQQVQQTVIYEIKNKQGDVWGRYLIFPGRSGKGIQLMKWLANNLEPRQGFLKAIDDEIRKLLRQRISFDSLIPLEVFQVNLYLAVDGQYGKDFSIEFVGKSLDSNAELIAKVVDRLDKSGLVELTKEDHICLTSEGVEGTRVLIDENMPNLLSKETIDESREKVDDEPIWFPKKERYRCKWAEVYFEVIQPLREEYVSITGVLDNEQSDKYQVITNTDLTPREQAIVDIYNELLAEAMPVTDDIIALQLQHKGFYNKRTGIPYTRESVNRWRNGLIKRGYKLNV